MAKRSGVIPTDVGAVPGAADHQAKQAHRLEGFPQSGPADPEGQSQLRLRRQLFAGSQRAAPKQLFKAKDHFVKGRGSLNGQQMIRAQEALPGGQQDVKVSGVTLAPATRGSSDIHLDSTWLICQAV